MAQTNLLHKANKLLCNLKKKHLKKKVQNIFEARSVTTIWIPMVCLSIVSWEPGPPLASTTIVVATRWPGNSRKAARNRGIWFLYLTNLLGDKLSNFWLLVLFFAVITYKIKSFKKKGNFLIHIFEHLYRYQSLNKPFQGRSSKIWLIWFIWTNGEPFSSFNKWNIYFRRKTCELLVFVLFFF